MQITANHRKVVPATRYQRYHVEIHNGTSIVARHHFATRWDAKRYADKVGEQGLYQFTLVPEDGTVIHVCHNECEEVWQ